MTQSWTWRSKVGVGVFGLMLLVILAWVASNSRWADASPRPVPAALQPRAVTLAPEHNAFFDGIGLEAPRGQSPNLWGQARWRGEAEAAAPRWAWPSSSAWACKASETDCMAQWRANAAVLREQMAAAAPLGERCAQWADAGEVQEPARERPESGPLKDLPFAALPLPSWSGGIACARWFQVQAASATEPATEPATALRWLARSAALSRKLATGMQSLPGQALSWAMLEQHAVFVSQWAAAQPQQAAAALAVVAPLPAAAHELRWVATESDLVRHTVLELPQDCRREHPEALGAQRSGWDRFTCATQLGLLHQQSVQDHEDALLAGLAASRQGLCAAAKSRAWQPKPAAELAMPGALHWRNTTGQWLLDVSAALSNHAGYVARQADLELHQTAARLALQLDAVPSAERADWLAAQNLPADLKPRLRLDGHALIARGCRNEVEPGAAPPLRWALAPS